MPDLIKPAANAHDEAEVLLPWYATGQLDERDRASVDDHLSSCASCRRQLAAEHRLIEELRESEPRADEGWARIRARLDEQVVVRPKFGRAAELWGLARRPAVGMLAAAQLAFVILAGGVLVSLSRPSYHALGSAPAPAAANVIVIFKPQTTEADIRAALTLTDASLVGGPTPANAYLLHVPAAERQGALKRLQANREIVMAQPIDQAASS